MKTELLAYGRWDVRNGLCMEQETCEMAKVRNTAPA